MMIKNIRKDKLALLVLCVALFSISCGNNKTRKNESADIKKSQRTVTVFAATSLTDVISDLVDSFELEKGVNVIVNLASSGTLARQIEQGATPDIFISASTRWADYIADLGYLVKGYTSQVARNKLVLVSPQNSAIERVVIDSSLNFVTLLGKSRLSLGDPSHVPAGKYAKQSLNYFGWFNPLKNQLLPAKDVRSALMVVEMEEVLLGIVYRTDALKSQKVKILSSFPEKSHNPIVYIAGICNERELTKEFISFINSSESNAIWEKYGFLK